MARAYIVPARNDLGVTTGQQNPLLQVLDLWPNTSHRNYAIDGIHLDYIRYPDAQSCYCAGCRARFAAARGSPVVNWPRDVMEGASQGAYLAWRHKQITTFVEQASKAVKGVRKDVAVSVAVFSAWPSCRDTVGQDWVNWARLGVVDFVCPMNYVADDALAATLTAKQLAAVGGHTPVYPGLGPSAESLPPEQVVHQVDLVREAGAGGFVLFELDQDLLDLHLPALRSGATDERR